jgi:cellulose synthase/poly-beta-1,6-N-acetylglucosamine synthase-like glycosyltransferase
MHTALILVLVGVPALAWWIQLIVLARVVRAVPRLVDLPLEERAAWPRVSVILTACNEEASLEEAVRARLTETYPALELILVEDRSTDGTPAIADRLAADDPRLKVVHITELPEGWLGKLHALHRGAALATGEWLLFSDADVSARDGVLRRVVAHCERRGLDHCVVLPRFAPVSPLLDGLLSVFARMAALSMRIWAIEDPRSKVAVGAGAFNLVRRSALARTPGFEWLKMEVADDLALGQMLKAHGARQSVLNGVGLVELVFVRRLSEALRSSERATWTAIANFRLSRLVAMAAVVLWTELGPLAALLAGPGSLAFWLGLAGLAPMIAASVLVNRWCGRALGPLLLLPVAQIVSAYAMLRAGVLGRLRRGIRWRGTFYPEAQLRAGRRIQL